MKGEITEQAGAKEPHAAVAIILRSGQEGPEVLLIQRATREGDPWSGQMAFPGGRSESQDNGLHETAVRETAEEVGDRLAESMELLGRLDDLEAIARGRKTGLTISPFVYWLDKDVSLAPSPAEVAEVFWTPVTPLLRGDADSTHLYRHNGVPMRLPAYLVQGKSVWGLTYKMLAGFLERLR